MEKLAAMVTLNCSEFHLLRPTLKFALNYPENLSALNQSYSRIFSADYSLNCTLLGPHKPLMQ